MKPVTVDAFIRDYQQKHAAPYTPQAGEKLESAVEYARRCGISPVAVRERIKRGLIAGEKIGGRYMVKIAEEAHPVDTAELARLKSENEVLRLRLQMIRDALGAEQNETGRSEQA